MVEPESPTRSLEIQWEDDCIGNSSDLAHPALSYLVPLLCQSCLNANAESGSWQHF